MEYNTHISIIIPVFNDAENIGHCLRHLMAHGKNAEIILVDGGSEDSTIAVAQEFPVRIYGSDPGTARQMNLGAAKATRDILYFLRADSFPPESFVLDIYSSLLQGYEAGCFKVKYQSRAWGVRMNGLLAKYNLKWAGAEDQSLFLFREKFLEIGGFDETFGVMEDYDLVDRLKREDAFDVVENEIEIRGRHHPDPSFFKTQLSNILVYQMYRLGYHGAFLNHSWQRLLQR